MADPSDIPTTGTAPASPLTAGDNEGPKPILGIRRVAAWLIDMACILGWVALTATVGIPLYLAGIIVPVGQIQLNLIGALVVVAPVVVGAAIFESRAKAATPGKRVLGLRVSTRAGAQTDAVPTVVWIFTTLASLIPVAYVVSLFVGTGRAPYDRVARTTVVRSAPD